MNRKISLWLLLLTLSVFFCSKKMEEKPVAGGTKNTKTPIHGGAIAAPKKTIEIKTVNLIPETTTVLDDVTAVPLLDDSNLGNVNYQFQWFVNGREIPAATNSILKKGNFKKSDWLFCQVKAIAEGMESSWFRSAIIRVNNSLPAFNLPPIGNFSIPGDFQYQITAGDADKDELTYELLAPLDMGIELDKKTGLLAWNLDNALVEKLGESVDISFSVSDNDAKPTTGSIILRFQKKTVKKNP